MCTSHWGESLKCPVIPATEPLSSFELRFAAMLSGWVCGGGVILRALQFLCSQIRAPRHKKSVSKGGSWGKWALDWLVWIQKVTLLRRVVYYLKELAKPGSSSPLGISKALTVKASKYRK